MGMRSINRKMVLMCLPVGWLALSVLPNVERSGGSLPTACTDLPSSSVAVAGTVDPAEVVVSLHSVRAIRDSHAHDLGALSEWQPGYYVAHWWSPSGQSILGMETGDIVMLDGLPVRIDGVTKYPKDEILEHVREDLGYDCIIFQTCYPDEYNRIVYGHADGMGGFTIVRK